MSGSYAYYSLVSYVGSVYRVDLQYLRVEFFDVNGKDWEASQLSLSEYLTIEGVTWLSNNDILPELAKRRLGVGV